MSLQRNTSNMCPYNRNTPNICPNNRNTSNMCQYNRNTPNMCQYNRNTSNMCQYNRNTLKYVHTTEISHLSNNKMMPFCKPLVLKMLIKIVKKYKYKNGNTESSPGDSNLCTIFQHLSVVIR